MSSTETVTEEHHKSSCLNPTLRFSQNHLAYLHTSANRRCLTFIVRGVIVLVNFKSIRLYAGHHFTDERCVDTWGRPEIGVK